MSSEPRANNWGRWGEDDERGAVNLLTPEVVLAACSRPKTGKVYELGIELRRDAPVGGNRISPLHFMTQDGGDFAALGRLDWGTADDYMVLATQGTTHVDGLAHVWSGGKLYNGFPFTDVRSSGTARLGLEKLGGLVATAHFLDFTHLIGENAREITPDDVDKMFEGRGVKVKAGDALLFRTGWMDDALTGTQVEGTYPAVSLAMGGWIREHDISIVGADNVAVEATGRRGVLPPLHEILVRDLGVTLLELLDLQTPGTDEVTEGLLVVAPLRISRGVGSPVNPLLIV